MKKVDCKIELVTPFIAEEWLEKNTNNRNINQHIVRQYANSMQRGDWELSNDAICFDKSGKLTNGQHRLRAIILSKRSYEFLVARNMEEKSYLAMDRGRLRSIGAQLSIMGVANSNRISSGISTYIFLHSTYKHKKNCDNVERTAHRILDIYNSYKEDIEILIRWSQNVYAKSKVIPNSIILGLSLFLIKDGDISDNIVRYFFDSISSLDSCDDNFLNSVRKYLLTQSKKNCRNKKSIWYDKLLLYYYA